MRTIVCGIALVMLAGCATTRVPSIVTDTQRDECRAESDAAEMSGLRKALIYSSNIVVFPVTTALTLGFGSMVVYPMSEGEWKAKTYERCMAKIGG